MVHIRGNIVAAILLILFIGAFSAFAHSDEVIKSLKENGDFLESANSIKLRSGLGNPITGKEKSQLCQGCHGEDGNSTDPIIPKLAGQYANYIVKQLRNYQAGTRSHQIMNAMAATVSDEDLADIAAYFASQKKMAGDGSSDNSLGKELFLHGDPSLMRLACVNCHGAKGKGVNPKISMFPVIGGQHNEYLKRQLINFRDSNRTNSPNNIMTRIAEALTDVEIESLAEYISVQQ
jgi:cytochrome c553